MRIVYLSKVKRNPYVSLLCDAVNRADDGCCAEIADHFSLGWMWRQRARVELLHIHWLELFFVYPSALQSVKRWLSVMLGLLLARWSGVALVYTVHNIWHHESKRPLLVALGNRVLLLLADLVHVHDEGTAKALEGRWGRSRGVVVIPHGSYVGAYPDGISRQQARQALGVPPEAFCFLSLGRVRPYKGLEDLVSAFGRLDDAEAVLVIAGEPQEPHFGETLRAAADCDPRIRLHLGFVAEDDLQRYFRACDVCVLPYRHVTTSGAAILAFSFGTPVIAPEIGSFRQLVDDGCHGILYCPDDDGALLRALSVARVSPVDQMRSAVQARVRTLDWSDLSASFVAGYRQVASCNHKPSG